MINYIEALKDKFCDRHVVLAGNGPSLDLLTQSKLKGKLVATVNSGLPFFYRNKMKVDLFWVQDLRMTIGKIDYVRPYLKNVDFVLYNEQISYFSGMESDRYIPVTMLGYVGFSLNLEMGIFHGYNASYGLLQILVILGVKKISLYGVGLNYSASNPRFYQKTRGLDVDLHRASDQVAIMRSALTVLANNGVEVEIVGGSMLDRATPI